MDYPWYESIKKGDPSIQQGDIVEDCPIVIPDADYYRAYLANKDGADVDIKVFSGIVLSQSCDIENNKIDSIILCPIRSLADFMKNNTSTKKEKEKAREKLRQGLYNEYHLLQKFKGRKLAEDFYYVDFHHIYSVPKDFVKELLVAHDRERLLPPYREHLAQDFARYFMRVGLPANIDSNEIKNYSNNISIVSQETDTK
jgi:hypothetical protein